MEDTKSKELIEDLQKWLYGENGKQLKTIYDDFVKRLEKSDCFLQTNHGDLLSNHINFKESLVTLNPENFKINVTEKSFFEDNMNEQGTNASSSNKLDKDYEKKVVSCGVLLKELINELDFFSKELQEDLENMTACANKKNYTINHDQKINRKKDFALIESEMMNTKSKILEQIRSYNASVKSIIKRQI